MDLYTKREKESVYFFLIIVKESQIFIKYKKGLFYVIVKKVIKTRLQIL